MGSKVPCWTWGLMGKRSSTWVLVSKPIMLSQCTGMAEVTPVHNFGSQNNCKVHGDKSVPLHFL